MCPRINKLRVARKDLGIKKYEGLAPTSCCCEHTHVCCRISKLGVAQGSGVTSAWPTRCCCEHTHVCFRIDPIHSRLHPRIKRLYGVGRRTAAVSIHMCVWQNHMSTQGLHRGSKRYKSWADQILLRPGAAASTHMCVPEKTNSFKVAPKDQRLYGVGRRTAAVSTHMCVWQNHMSTQGLHRGSKKYKSLADQLLLRAYTYVCQKQFQVAPKDHRLHGTGRPTARICQVKVAPKDQGIQVYGRPCVAVSIHMCLAECINSGLHLSVKGCNGLADQLLHVCCRKNQLRVGLADHILIEKHTCVQLQGFGRPRNTHVCPRKNTLRVARKDSKKNQEIHGFGADQLLL